jgi:hypothetical protein
MKVFTWFVLPRVPLWNFNWARDVQACAEGLARNIREKGAFGLTPYDWN